MDNGGRGGEGKEGEGRKGAEEKTHWFNRRKTQVADYRTDRTDAQRAERSQIA